MSDELAAAREEEHLRRKRAMSAAFTFEEQDWMKNASTRTTARDGVSGARTGSGVGHAKAAFESGVDVGAGQASKLKNASSMPRSGVIRETLMPDGSTLITIAPEARRAASARAQRIITEIRAKARRDCSERRHPR